MNWSTYVYLETTRHRYTKDFVSFYYSECIELIASERYFIVSFM